MERKHRIATVGEDDARTEAEKKGANPCESAPRTDTADSTTTDRPVFWPLTWRAAADRKRGMRGAVDTTLAGWLVLALVAGVLLAGVAR